MPAVFSDDTLHRKGPQVVKDASRRDDTFFLYIKEQDGISLDIFLNKDYLDSLEVTRKYLTVFPESGKAGLELELNVLAESKNDRKVNVEFELNGFTVSKQQ